MSPPNENEKSPDRATILKDVESRLAGRLSYFDSYLHGLSHLREVAMLAGQIAAEGGADVEAAMVAGFMHDCARVNDGGGNRHALDSAKLARPLVKELWPHLDADKICYAIAAHADGMISDDPIVGAVWDADRLTLARLGHRVLLNLLSTESGRRIARERGIAYGHGPP
jgi:uncharacterized protein